MTWRRIIEARTGTGRFEDICIAGNKLYALHRLGYLIIVEGRNETRIDLSGHLTNPDDDKLRCITFGSDGKTGYIGIIRKYTTTPRMLKTTDSGQTWNPIEIDNGPDRGICGICTLDGQFVWASGIYQENTSNGVIASTNGGLNWDYVCTQPRVAIDIKFTTQKNGLVVGSSADGNPAIWVTTNSGRDWEQSNLDLVDVEKGKCWKIFQNNLITAVSVSSGESRSTIFTSDNFTDPDSWQTNLITLPPPQIHELGGLYHDGQTWHLGINGKSTYTSTDLETWTVVYDSDNRFVEDVNRFIPGANGVVYAAGEDIFAY